MGHDKLLTMIEDKFNNHSGLHDAQIVNSLYRVVELHKPSENDSWGSILCVNCLTYEYPCPTIQTIEKELQ